jgi:hypothetical protein
LGLFVYSINIGVFDFEGWILEMVSMCGYGNEWSRVCFLLFDVEQYNGICLCSLIEKIGWILILSLQLWDLVLVVGQVSSYESFGFRGKFLSLSWL